MSVVGCSNSATTVAACSSSVARFFLSKLARSSCSSIGSLLPTWPLQRRSLLCRAPAPLSRDNTRLSSSISAICVSSNCGDRSHLPVFSVLSLLASLLVRRPLERRYNVSVTPGQAPNVTPRYSRHCSCQFLLNKQLKKHTL